MMAVCKFQNSETVGIPCCLETRFNLHENKKKKKKKNPQQKMQCLKAFSKEAITDRLICKK